MGLTHRKNPANIRLEPGRGFLKTMASIVNKITTFLKEVRLEMKKVNWPSRQETIQYTLIVIGVSVVVAIYLGGLDFIFSFLLNKLILR